MKSTVSDRTVSSPGPKNDNGFTSDAMQGLVGVSICAAFFGFVYGLLQNSLEGGMIALLASLLGYGIGGLSGFLFGFPRYTESATIANQEDLKRVLTGKPAEDHRRSSLGGLSASTNLERIVDWLMTMIIGATLVNLQALVKWAEENCRALTKVMEGSQSSASAVPGALVVVPFAIAGFLHLYLWSRRYLLDEWTQAEATAKLKERVDSVSDKQQKIQESQNQLEEDLSRINTQLFKVARSTLLNLENALKSNGADDETVNDIIARFGQAAKWDDDPFANFGQLQSHGFSISAKLREIREESPADPYEVTLSVQRDNDVSFTGVVVFLFHHTFETPFAIANVNQRSSTTFTTVCAEPFVIGAVIIHTIDGEKPQKGTIRLALDLASLPNNPEGFGNNKASEK